MKKERLAAIEKAAQALRRGKYHDQFKVDWYPGRRGHVHQHERQRGDGEHRARAHGS